MPFLPRSLAEKATDLNYAYLLLIVVLYIDILLQFKGMEVLKTTVSSLAGNISLGEYIVSFALLIMFVGPFLKYFSIFIFEVKFYLCKKFCKKESHVPKCIDKVYLSDFERCMVRQNNMLGFTVAQEKRRFIHDKRSLQRNCSGFLLLSFINVIMAILGKNVLMRALLDWFQANEESLMLGLLFSAIAMFIFLHALATVIEEPEREDNMIDNYGIDELISKKQYKQAYRVPRNNHDVT